MDQEAAPLFEGLMAYESHGLLGFHTPGHTGGRTFDLAELAALDLTEVPIWPGGPGVTGLVAEAERLAAELFKAGTTFFLTNGATSGIQAMLLGTCPRGTAIVVGRDCHRSVMAACILGDLRPEFIPPQYVDGWSFPGGTSPAELMKALAGPAPVLITNPTYQGVFWDLKPLAAVPGRLLVDEAHGAHLIFLTDAGAAAAGALAWVHGSHKTLGSLTQTGMLHLRTGVGREPYAEWLDRLNSTSPSYPLLASLDLARRWAALSAAAAWREAGERLDGLRQRLRRAGIRVLAREDLPAGASPDPAKLTLHAPAGGLQSAAALVAKHGIQVEAAGLDWLTLLITPFHAVAELDRLAKALAEEIGPFADAGTGRWPPWPRRLPTRVCWPQEAGSAPKQHLPLRECRGKVAAAPLGPYPPGIPLVWPGERIDEEFLTYLESVRAEGVALNGVDARGTAAVMA